VELNIWTELHSEVEHFDPVLPEEFYGWINQVGSRREEGLFQILKKKKYNVLVPSLQNMADCALQCQWMNGITVNYEEKAQLNKCDLSARLKTG